MMGEPHPRPGQHPATFNLTGRHGVAQAAPLRFDAPAIIEEEREVVRAFRCLSPAPITHSLTVRDELASSSTFKENKTLCA